MARALVLAMAVACGGKQPVDPANTPAGATLCRDMASHLVRVLEPQGADDAMVQKIEQALRERCVDDKWTLDAQRCFGAIRTIADSDTCATLLTVDQRDAFQRALEAALR